MQCPHVPYALILRCIRLASTNPPLPSIDARNQADALVVDDEGDGLGSRYRPFGFEVTI